MFEEMIALMISGIGNTCHSDITNNCGYVYIGSNLQVI